MNTPQPQVSILLSVYNGAKTLSACLESIANQTYTNWQLIAIDDASTDTSASLLQDFLKTHPGRLITQPKNLGLTKSLNRGLQHAQGAYIARLDADDIWHPDKLAKQINYLTTHPEVGVVGSWYYNCSLPLSKGEVRRGYYIKKPVTDKQIRTAVFRTNPFGHSCVIIRRQLLTQIGGYDESIPYGQDYDLWLRLLPHTNFHNLPKYLCTRLIPPHPNHTKQRQQMRQMIKTILKHAHRPSHYLGILTPLAIIATPSWLKRLRP